MRKILATIAACSALIGCATPTAQELASADFGSYPTNYEIVIKSYMSTILKDPDSARYNFLNSPKSGWSGFGAVKYGYIVCVNINAKNCYGGYTGNRMSYFMIKNDRVIDASHGGGDFGDATVQGKCSKFI
jgi:hypothetical protein